MATRHQVRQCVIGMLYAHELGGDGTSEELLEERKIRNDQREWCLSLFNGTLAHVEELDAVCNQFLGSWNMSEVGSVNRAILRLGAYELKFTKTDKAIVISEAVNLASELTSESGLKLINGVLDKIER